MGEHKVSLLSNKKQMHHFVRQLLADIRALEYMLENNWFESGITRIGAEQEMCLVDKKTYKPAPISMEVLAKMKNDAWVETELAKFNLETTQEPRELKAKCFSLMEEEIRLKLDKIKGKVSKFDAEVVLCGILPTLRMFHLEMEYLTPEKRYYALMEAINAQLEGNAYELRLMGIDELLIKHDSPLLEACNTSFQVHLQVDAKDFVKMYNIAQTLTAPIMAIAANSPIVFGKRLWHETRIALFQQALDTRSSKYHMREKSPRVSFGNGWLQNSILEIYKEDIARFRVLIAGDIKEDSGKLISKNQVPKLRALQVHNGTVYRWNRPCYGISPNGQPHLRIENRVLAAGPTVVDEIANTAFWMGIMVGMADEVDDIREMITWEDVRDNFGKAAKFGIDSNFTWFNDEKISACDLVLKKLIPMAKKGLKKRKVNQKDIDKYMGIIEARAEMHMNGARWQLRAYTKLMKETNRDEALTCLTASIIANQKKGIPVHTWKMPKLSDLKTYSPSKMLVEEFMFTDLFTVRKDDIVDLVADIMDWKSIRYTPVENKDGELVGMITSKLILNHYINNKQNNGKTSSQVKDVMDKNPPTIEAKDSIKKAMKKMKEFGVGCLPVVKDKELVGMITENDFIRISNRLIERQKS